LAKATGQPAALDDTLAAHVLAFAEQAITPDTRAPRIGPALPAAVNAPLTDRLVAFLGRQPRIPTRPSKRSPNRTAGPSCSSSRTMPARSVTSPATLTSPPRRCPST